VATTEKLQDAVVVRHTIAAPPEKVWAVLVDGWVYPTWVVGATRMREVDADWPSPGSKLHHSVGVWPAVINDFTESLDWVEGERLLLRAHGWPAGAAEVELTLEARDGGTEVTMREDAVAGPGRLVPHPVRQALSMVRNREGLRRLGFIAEHRTPVHR
jgi:uncharacterized protein YndB with AHSA1/START domain